MQPLNLPEFDIRIQSNTVFCLVRKKWVVLTPEEWVRQHFLNLIIHHLGYPKGMMRLEHSMNYFKNVKRSDITVLDREGGIHMLVECKAPTVAIDQKVLNQVSEYNKVLNSKYIAISNGLKHFIWEKKGSSLNQISSFPEYHPNH